VLSVLEIIESAGQEDASSLTICLGFYYVGSAFSFGFALEICPEVSILQRKHPSQWKKIILLRKMIPQSHQVDSKKIFPSNGMDARIMIDFLKEMHFDEHIRINSEISPKNIPITSFITILYFPT